MKQSLFLIIFSLILFSCTKEENTSTAPIDEPPIISGNVLAQGTMSGSGGHNVSGLAKVIESNGTKTIRFENFSSTNGPDLKVYLAKDANASAFINLGNLKSTNGNQQYDISGMPSLSEYKYVLIWCQQFGVLFGSALLN